MRLFPVAVFDPDGQGRGHSDRDAAANNDETGTLNSFDVENKDQFRRDEQGRIETGATNGDEADVLKGTLDGESVGHETAHIMGVAHASDGGSLPAQGSAVSKGYIAESLKGVGIGGKNSGNRSGVGIGTLINNSSNSGLEKGVVISERKYNRIMRRINKEKKTNSHDNYCNAFIHGVFNHESARPS